MREKSSAGAAPSAAVFVLEQLRQEIFAGQLAGGEAIREDEVADRFSVSRTPVREAMARLLAEGLVTKESNRAVRVFKPSIRDLREIYEIRLPLETLAARMAAEQADDHFVSDLEALWRAINEATPGAEWSAAHERFHMRIFEGSGRPRLERLIANLRAQSEPYIRMAIQVDAPMRHKGQHDHSNIIEAMRNRDGASAKRITERHLKAAIKRIPQILGY